MEPSYVIVSHDFHSAVLMLEAANLLGLDWTLYHQNGEYRLNLIDVVEK